jgi:hypothetical protein
MSYTSGSHTVFHHRYHIVRPAVSKTLIATRFDRNFKPFMVAIALAAPVIGWL